VGEEVIFQGTPRGVAFFHRIGFISEFNYLLQRHENGNLLLKPECNVPFQVVYPGAPGDSGGGIFNHKGELCGIMYLGLSTNEFTIILSNPTANLRAFLVKAGYLKRI
jgi:hypothetical protein